MALAPVEIRHTRLKRSLFGGYRKRATNEFLDRSRRASRRRGASARTCATRWSISSELRRHRELEALLRETLLSAEKSAIELKEQARTEAELVIREAHTAARSITQDALAQRERLQSEAIRVRALLRPVRRRASTSPSPTVIASPWGRLPRRPRPRTANLYLARWRARSCASASFPASASLGIVGRHGDSWKIRVRRRCSERGRANDAVVESVRGHALAAEE